MSEHSPYPDVAFDHVSIAYQDRIALEDVTFSIARGSFWGIIGPNGSGKTTLVRAIIGLVGARSGRIRTFGVDPRDLREQRTLIGYVPQSAEVDFSFPISVSDAVLMGGYGKAGRFRRLSRELRDATAAALERVQISDLAARQIGELSGGQRQRMLIARALVLHPRLLILDEPTAALDHTSSEGLYEWLHGLNETDGTTILLVSHDIGVVSKWVDSVACLNTRLVAHGRPSDILTTSALESMYGCGAVIFQHGHIPHMVVDADPHTHSGDGA
ncbi:MAG: metal ABC transporter ATP-binding protein [Ignavibacteria bacterium]|nr:metal ABC transporter ATP-binding protein [Ignavibacteria bacterium]